MHAIKRTYLEVQLHGDVVEKQQPGRSSMMQYPSHRTDEEDVQACIDWLNTAVAQLNPTNCIHHAITLSEMTMFLANSPPPPPLLQDIWRTRVWAMAWEPYQVHLLRCLAHHSGVTMLSQHFDVSSSTGDIDVSGPAMTELVFQRGTVVGHRVLPARSDMLQTGWNAQPCSYCTAKEQPMPWPTTEAEVASQPQPPVLPFLYGGATCPRCGQAYPLEPSWTRCTYLVVEWAGQHRAAAIAYGDALRPHLFLGAKILALLYNSTTEDRHPMCVIHSCCSSTITPPPALPLATSSLCNSYVLECRRQLEYRWCSSMTLQDMAGTLSPSLHGQQCVKAMLLLVMVHTLYHVRHQQMSSAGSASRVAPLHMLLIGQAKSGKSQFLREAAHMMGSAAQLVDATVVNQRSSASGSRGAALEAMLPAVRGAVLLGGANVTASSLLLDGISSFSPTSLCTLVDILEHSSYSCAAKSAEGEAAAAEPSQIFHIPMQVTATAQAESRTVQRLASSFPLVGLMSPTHSIIDSAMVSQDVVAASLARSSSASATRSVSRGSSASLARQYLAPSPQRSSRLPSGACDSGQTLSYATHRAMTVDDLAYLVDRASSPTMLSSILTAEVCLASYSGLLESSQGLIEAATGPRSIDFPPPSSMRGERGGRSSLIASCGSHLRVLSALSLARLILGGPNDDATATHRWTSAMRDEVWAVYFHHLRTVADLQYYSSTTPVSSDTALQYRHRAPRVRPKKLSVKRCKLLMVERLKQQQSTTEAAVVSVVDVNRIFNELGGVETLGDSVDVVLSQLQRDALLLRRPGGWRVMV